MAASSLVPSESRITSGLRFAAGPVEAPAALPLAGPAGTWTPTRCGRARRPRRVASPAKEPLETPGTVGCPATQGMSRASAVDFALVLGYFLLWPERCDQERTSNRGAPHR